MRQKAFPRLARFNFRITFLERSQATHGFLRVIQLDPDFGK